LTLLRGRGATRFDVVFRAGRRLDDFFFVFAFTFAFAAGFRLALLPRRVAAFRLLRFFLAIIGRSSRRSFSGFSSARAWPDARV
jgi:hypothetical protein